MQGIPGFTLGQKTWVQHRIYSLHIKVDIEGHELDVLPEWIESGALEKVFQVKSCVSLLFQFFSFLGGPVGLGASSGKNTHFQKVAVS